MTELLVFADLHAHNFKEFDERTAGTSSVRLDYIVETIYSMGDYALEHGIRTILFAGDLFHVRAKVNTLVYNAIFNAISDLTNDTEIEFVMIPGNHDQLDNSDYPEHSLAPFSAIHNVTILDKIKFYDVGNVSILSVPYSKNTTMVREKIAERCDYRGKIDTPAIMLGHLGVTGGLVGKGNYAMADAFTVDDLMPDYFKGVYLGHFHKYQKLGGHDHVMYIGAPIQHSFSDEGEPKGFVHITVNDDNTVDNKFVALEVMSQSGNKFPTFHTVKFPEEIADISKHAENNNNSYFRFLVKESEVDTLKLAIPENAKYKLEITREYAEQQRTDVKVGMSFEEIVKTYAEEHNPIATELGLDILKEASENRV
ncbi:nuclease SbcCD subunit D [Exiguobacterium phage vB_EalM-132]|nr:nuclease SbcCD subunit D [Exiguobacterium phage vB_EalM-132]